MEKGYGNVFALKGGWQEWEETGFPMDEKIDAK